MMIPENKVPGLVIYIGLRMVWIELENSANPIYKSTYLKHNHGLEQLIKCIKHQVVLVLSKNQKPSRSLKCKVKSPRGIIFYNP